MPMTAATISGAKARFREKEQQVYEELHDLVERADVHRDALAATYNVTRDIMALAEVCGDDMWHHVCMH